MTEVLVIGAGPAGLFAALRAADLGAQTTLITKAAFGGMAANDGPIPVRTLAHAARLAREARQLGAYGIAASNGTFDYGRLLARVGEVVAEAGSHAILRPQLDAAGVTVHEHVGDARFIDPHTVETGSGLRLTADRMIICTGGTSRRLDTPGFELTCTHSDAWSLTSVPESILVIGGGATGAQVASIFNALGSRIALYQAGERILPTDDADVSAAVANAFRANGIEVHEDFGMIQSFERTATGVAMNFSKDGVHHSAEAAIIVAAVGWVANTAGMNLDAAGVALNARGSILVDAFQRTTTPHIFAAGDVVGAMMLTPQAMQAGFLAATNAAGEVLSEAVEQVCPIGSFTEPEYAQVGLTEAKAGAGREIVIGRADYADATRPIIDGRTQGFCKLIVGRADGKILGCHVVGERAVDVVQLVAVAMAAGMGIEAFARVPFSFPTYAGILGRAAAKAAYQLNKGPAWGAASLKAPVHFN